MKTIMVQYKTLGSRAMENAALVRSVFEALHARAPQSIRYTAYGMPDGVSFVHIATVDDPGANPLTVLPAFQAFQRDLRARCVASPVVTELTTVASYR